MSTQVQAATTTAVYKCPGHSEFHKHFAIKNKAKRKAEKAVSKLLNSEDVIKADYTLLDKKTVEGKESGHFKRLNRIFYRYATVLNYTHADNAENCAHIQAQKA